METPLHNIPNRWKEKQDLIDRMCSFRAKAERPNSKNPQWFRLTDEEKKYIKTVRRELTVSQVKNHLRDPRFYYNPARWYEVEWLDENEPPVLVITNFYCQPLVITVTRINGETITGDAKLKKGLYGYAAREMQIIADKMMIPSPLDLQVPYNRLAIVRDNNRS